MEIWIKNDGYSSVNYIDQVFWYNKKVCSGGRESIIYDGEFSVLESVTLE